jgi:hypothetical protein
MFAAELLADAVAVFVPDFAVFAAGLRAAGDFDDFFAAIFNAPVLREKMEKVGRPTIEVPAQADTPPEM